MSLVSLSVFFAFSCVTGISVLLRIFLNGRTERKLEIIGGSAEAYLFFTDNDGRVMIASSPDKLEPDRAGRNDGRSTLPMRTTTMCSARRHAGRKSYITVSEMRNENGQPSGYLFLCSSGGVTQ